MALPAEADPKSLEKPKVRAQYANDMKTRPGPSAMKEPVVHDGGCLPTVFDLALCGMFRSKQDKVSLTKLERSNITKRQIAELKKTIYSENQPFNVRVA